MRFFARLARIRRDFESRRLSACPDCGDEAIAFDCERTDPTTPNPFPAGPCPTCGRVRSRVTFRRIRGVTVEEAERRYLAKRPKEIEE